MLCIYDDPSERPPPRRSFLQYCPALDRVRIVRLLVCPSCLSLALPACTLGKKKKKRELEDGISGPRVAPRSQTKNGERRRALVPVSADLLCAGAVTDSSHRGCRRRQDEWGGGARRSKWDSLVEREKKKWDKRDGEQRTGGGGGWQRQQRGAASRGGRRGQGSSLWCELAASTWPPHVACSPPGQS